MLQMNKTSIIVDASKYIGELKEKVERLNQEIGTSQNQFPMVKYDCVVLFFFLISCFASIIIYLSLCSFLCLQQVTVETLKKGFLINVLSEKNCPGLLVSILEAFEGLSLDVIDARVSCEDNFQLEAVGGDVRNCSNFFCFFGIAIFQRKRFTFFPHYVYFAYGSSSVLSIL